MPNRAETYTLLACLAFIIALFPNLFHTLWTFPFSIVSREGSSSPSRSPSCCASEPCCPSHDSVPAVSPQTPPTNPSMSWFQTTIKLPSRSRGSYLITDHVMKEVPQIKDYRVGILHLFAQHTSCALGMNENWDEEVRADMSDAMDRLVPEDRKGQLYRHAAEGPDDMPAHIKAALVGSSVSIPISNGRLATGTWQGIWYFEFRTSKHSRNLVATIQGEKMS